MVSLVLYHITFIYGKVKWSKCSLLISMHCNTLRLYLCTLMRNVHRRKEGIFAEKKNMNIVYNLPHRQIYMCSFGQASYAACSLYYKIKRRQMEVTTRLQCNFLSVQVCVFFFLSLSSNCSIHSWHARLKNMRILFRVSSNGTTLYNVKIYLEFLPHQKRVKVFLS